MVIKEEIKVGKPKLHSSMERRIRFYFDLIVDLCRIFELLSRWVPEVFLAKEQIHLNRLLDYMFFVLSSLFKMEFK